MRSSLASRSGSEALAAAMSRHPAAGARASVPARAVRPSFAAVAALLTGPWRVDDPVAFAAAMRSAPLVAGHPVIDLCRLTPPLSGDAVPSGGAVSQHPLSPGLGACARRPAVQHDPLSVAAAGHLETAVAAAAGRSALEVRWVAGIGGRYLFVEAAGRAPADGEGPELLVLAHLVEPAEAAEPIPGAPPLDDDSWVVVVVGDGRGGVAGIGRAPLPRPAAPRLRRRTGWADPPAPPAPRPPARLGLDGLRERLVGPARAAEGLDGPAAGGPPEAVVLPFRR